MDRDELILKFEGELADEHKLPAYNAALSLAGITRSIIIPAAYLENGKVRYRNVTNTRAFQLNLLTQRPGSFETLLELLTNPLFFVGVGYVADLGKDVAKDLIKDFITSVIKRAIGQKADAKIEDLESQGKINTGDMAALVDAISPAMRDAHTSIGNGASNIYVINGSRNVINLNAATKAYVYNSVRDDVPRLREFSIASFNANTGNGRAFDYEAGHTVAFLLDDDADSKTINAITESMRRYAHTRRLGDDLSSRVALKYTATLSPDGMIKKIQILEARSATKDIGG